MEPLHNTTESQLREGILITIEKGKYVYTKPVLKKEKGMSFPFKILLAGKPKAICKQCSSCHSCR